MFYKKFDIRYLFFKPEKHLHVFVHINTHAVVYRFFVAEELVYSLASVEETEDQSSLIYSLAGDDQTPAQPAAPSGLIANDTTVYQLAGA